LIINKVIVEFDWNQGIFGIDSIILGGYILNSDIADENSKDQANDRSEDLATVGAGLL
jgi:hypothetical protein